MSKFLYAASLAVILAFSNIASASDSAFGAGAAKENSAPTIQQMLEYAIQDEYLARSEYELILDKFAVQRPFSNIIRSEETHIKWLNDVYKNHHLTVPQDNAANYVKLPASLKEAFATGVQAEIENIAMYESFLKNPLLDQPENADIKSTFIKLMNASKNHLAAFEKGLSRY